MPQRKRSFTFGAYGGEELNSLMARGMNEFPTYSLMRPEQ
ncbi:hypothetical protein D4764_08G0009830 [Takifugu flavidus]|uniref:Uncharacterized protein n=1 Tax=Takifugu flavidus TaxID=433684 RepID=A0A5C6MPC9_9TELE|nr:hypothetical protein D4764_08G0009830 [Takifugu flavidus]